MEKLFEHVLMNDDRWAEQNFTQGTAHYDSDDDSAESLEGIYGGSNKTSFPKKNPYTKDGRLKRVPAACLFIARNPGSSRREIQAAIEEQGWTSYNNELFAHIRQQNLVRAHQEGRTPYYYPTFRCIDYLKMLGLIDKDEQLPYTVAGIFEDNSEESGRRTAVTSINRKEASTDNINFEDD